jgi:hypothetical protein
VLFAYPIICSYKNNAEAKIVNDTTGVVAALVHAVARIDKECARAEMAARK